MNIDMCMIKHYKLFNLVIAVFMVYDIKDFKEKLKNPKNWKKNQHYIPQFYLKKFCNKNWRLETLDKEKKRILKSQSVEHVCSWDYFYWLETWKKDEISQILEEIFNYFEDRFSQIYNNLINEIYSTHQIDSDLLYWLCEFVTISRMRWKYFRETFKGMSQDIIKKTIQMQYEMMKYYNRTRELIFNNRDKLDKLAGCLISNKTIIRKDIKQILS